MTTYSWILPVRNEAQSLPQLIVEISQVMRNKSWEVIAINDASTDSSLTTLKSFTLNRSGSGLTPLKVLSFSFPQGKWAALKAGFEAARGEIIITSDSDLQDDPKEIKKLLDKLNQGYDLVSGARMKRFDPFYKVFISKLGNFLVSKLTGKKFKDLNSSFKVYRKEVLDQIPKQGSLIRFSMLFAHRLGYKVAEVPINHRPRVYGKSKFGIVKYLRIIYDLILVMLLFSGSGRINKK